MKRIYGILFLLLVGALVITAITGCKQQAETKTGSVPAGEARPGRTRILLGQTPLWVEIADDPETLTRGLMFRKAMPEDEGMLFVFEYAAPQSFWMKNTYLPLDIAFISSDYRILNILSMKPLDEDPRYKSNGAALYALEVNQGWFARHGVKPGDQLSFR
jgi:uncharacterized protein